MGSMKELISKEKRRGRTTSIPVFYDTRDSLFQLMVDMGIFTTWTWDDFMKDMEKSKRELLALRIKGNLSQALTPQDIKLGYESFKREYEKNLSPEEKKKYYREEALRCKTKFDEVTKK